MPFQLAVTQGLDMELSVLQQELRIKSVLEQSRDAAPKQTCATTTEANNSQTTVPTLTVQVSDRLVRADGVNISLVPFEEALKAPMGSVMLLPLLKSVPGGQDGASKVLSGFARIEIFHPTTLEFEPTTVDREREVKEYKALVTKLELEELKRQLAAANDKAVKEQEEKDRLTADENAKLEKEAREKLEAEELERLSMTPHHRVAEMRGKGLEFRYEVEFTRNGPIGINWDLHTTDKTVVSYLEPALRAHALGIIASRDQLIQLNDVNTTEMGPHEVVAEYVKTSLPRTLVFMSASTRQDTGTGNVNASMANFVQNWTLAFIKPQVLSGWHVRLHLVNWSVMPEVDDLGQSKEMKLVQANPFLACHPLSEATSAGTFATEVMHVTYRGGCTFVDKAEHIRKANGSVLLVLNNVKGEGRFPPGVPTTGNVPLPVTMCVFIFRLLTGTTLSLLTCELWFVGAVVYRISKLDGEIVMAVMEHESPGDCLFENFSHHADLVSQ